MVELNATYLNRLRLLMERDRFYRPGNSTLASLHRQGLIVRTGRHDRFGREEWSASEAGRVAVTRAMTSAIVDRDPVPQAD